MSGTSRWMLYGRMGVSVAILVGLLGVFVVVLWVILVGGIAILLGPLLGLSIGTLATIVLLVWLVIVEYDRVADVRSRTDAVPVSPGAVPTLHATVTRVASQLDVPVPSIALSSSTTPEAMVVGYRPDSMTLVLSRGAIEPLSDAELEAVIAHELAHVANRDAMVMTVVSTPAILANGLRSRIKQPSDDSESAKRPTDSSGVSMSSLRQTAARVLLIVTVAPVGLFLLLFASTAVWIGGTVCISIFSRARETAADRTAVAVTGSSMALASALETLDERVSRVPERDLREVASVSSLSILPLDPIEVDPIMHGPAGDREPSLWSIRKPLRRLEARLVSTHPPTDRRIEAIRDLGRSE